MTCIQEPHPFFKGQGHSYILKIQHCHVLKAFIITWHKCLPHQDDMSHPRPLSQGIKIAINNTSFHKNNIKQLVIHSTGAILSN
jgi:hypothetical protein